MAMIEALKNLSRFWKEAKQNLGNCMEIDSQSGFSGQNAYI
jgi:hypothetical protein